MASSALSTPSIKQSSVKIRWARYRTSCKSAIAKLRGLADSHSTYRNQQYSPLLRLCAELRNKIYELALGGHTISAPSTLHNHSMFSSSLGWHVQEAALHYTCRQIRLETGDLHFILNMFTSNLYRVLNPKNLARHTDLQKIRHVQIRMCPRDVMRFQGTGQFSGCMKNDLDPCKKLEGLELVKVRLVHEATAEEEARLAMERYFRHNCRAVHPVSIAFEQDSGLQ